MRRYLVPGLLARSSRSPHRRRLRWLTPSSRARRSGRSRHPTTSRRAPWRPTTACRRTRRSCSARRSACQRSWRATPRCRQPGSSRPTPARHPPPAAAVTPSNSATRSPASPRTRASGSPASPRQTGSTRRGSSWPGRRSRSPTAAARPHRRPVGRARPRPPRAATRCAPGDTLSGLAAEAGVSMADMAAMNGLDPEGVLVEGTVLKLPSGAPAPTRSAEPAPAPVVPQADPAPTPATVGAADVQSVASQYGVSPSLAAAIAWQESGFNNAMVSSANARGVMQVMPGTWDYVQENLAQRPLDPNSATDNVHAGVMYLKRLLDETGATRAPRSRATTRGCSRCATAACSTTPRDTSTTCRRCARASAVSQRRSSGRRARRRPAEGRRAGSWPPRGARP